MPKQLYILVCCSKDQRFCSVQPQSIIECQLTDGNTAQRHKNCSTIFSHLFCACVKGFLQERRQRIKTWQRQNGNGNGNAFRSSRLVRKRQQFRAYCLSTESEILSNVSQWSFKTGKRKACCTSCLMPHQFLSRRNPQHKQNQTFRQHLCTNLAEIIQRMLLSAFVRKAGLTLFSSHQLSLSSTTAAFVLKLFNNAIVTLQSGCTVNSLRSSFFRSVMLFLCLVTVKNFDSRPKTSVLPEELQITVYC